MSTQQAVKPILTWWAGGIAIGLILTVATGLAQPIGVSTQYVTLSGVGLHTIAPDLAAGSAYLAKASEGWTLATYEFFFVLGIPLGAFCAAVATKQFSWRVVPIEWAARFGPSPITRLLGAFFGGFILLFGARLAGGCTSGHMLSGISQLAFSSFLFSATLFTSGIATARWLYRDGSGPA